MSYAQIDDGILDHPKLLDAGEDAANLFIRGIIWCNGKLTDGRITKSALQRLTMKRDAAKHAADLVRVGLWTDEGPHWQVHDYLQWNDSREKVLGRRARARERMKGVRANTNGTGGERA